MSVFQGLSAGKSWKVMAASTPSAWEPGPPGTVVDGESVAVVEEAPDAPVVVVGLGSGVAAVSAGVHHSCARSSAGTVRCWGDSSNGELGAGATAKSVVPVDVMGLG